MDKYIKLLRARQWYKNIVIFIAIFFTDNLTQLNMLVTTSLGFISLCLMSSSYYILNDIQDAKNDRKHPEKKNRPIAARTITVNQALLISVLLFTLSTTLAYLLSLRFMVFPLILFLTSMAYNLGLKNIPFIDIHIIALNFLIRAVSGAVLIGVMASPWLISTVFFLALLLAISKRRVELSLLGKEAVSHKKVYEIYTLQLLEHLILLVSGVLLINYALYTFMVHQGGAMMITIPFSTFIIFRYLHLVWSEHAAARKTQLLFLDKQIMTGFILWAITSYLILHSFG